MIDDKFQQHYRQQMSALMDGELAPDEARFLMRRMGEDAALGETWERWQLCGEVLRGRAPSPAPQGFAERVAAAVAVAGHPVQPAANQEFQRGRGRFLRWGGGAVAASVALFAMFIAGQQSRPQGVTQAAELADNTPAVAAPIGADRVPAQPTAPADPDPAASLAASAAMAVASIPRRSDESRRGSATRNQQAARATAAITRQTLAEVNAAKAESRAIAQVPANRQDPFGGTALGEASARPWPRATLPHLTGSGSYTAGYVQGEQAPYYPFQPQLPAATRSAQAAEAGAPDGAP